MVQESLAHKLRVLRAKRGLTLREAASLSGVAKETISDIERGLRHPHDPTLAKIAKGYGLPVEELLEEPVAAGKAEAPRSSPETEASRRAPDVDRLSSNLQDRIRNFLQRWMEVADYLQRLEGRPAGGYVWLLDLRRNVTREAAFLIRDLVELGDYVGLASNVPQVIHVAAERVRLAVDLAVTRAEAEEAAQWKLLMRELAYDLAKTKPEEEDEFVRVVDLAAERERRRGSDSDDTTAARGAV